MTDIFCGIRERIRMEAGRSPFSRIFFKKIIVGRSVEAETETDINNHNSHPGVRMLCCNDEFLPVYFRTSGRKVSPRRCPLGEVLRDKTLMLAMQRLGKGHSR